MKKCAGISNTIMAAAVLITVGACGDPESTPDVAESTAADTSIYSETYDRAIELGWPEDEAKDVAKAAENGEDVAWALEAPYGESSDTGGDADAPPSEPPLTDDFGLAYGAILTYRTTSSAGIEVETAYEYIDDGNDARILKVRDAAGDASAYIADIAGLATFACDGDMPPFNIIDALVRFDTYTVGETLSLQVSDAEPLYTYRVEALVSAEVGPDVIPAAIVSRTYEDTDDNGEIHTYEDRITVLRDFGIRAAFQSTKSEDRIALRTLDVPETAFEVEMSSEFVDDSALNNCATLFIGEE